jgi:adenosylcobinamide kinase / adenosylcobinamide-phosphate guanylyltransferase
MTASDTTFRNIHSLFVLGAARSGKSRYAQVLAERSRLKATLIATADAGDHEMAARIFAHRAERGPLWHTVEAPLELAEALTSFARSDTIVLLDCLTLWLSNLILNDCDVEAASQRLTKLIPRLLGPTIFVSNEVGGGGVPGNKLARQFQSAQGRLNQAVAAACDSVVLVAAGLPLALKPRVIEDLQFN